MFVDCQNIAIDFLTFAFVSNLVDFIELHFAHGYLLHSFLSPLSNVRNDKWGGEPLENRFRWPLRVAKLCRDEWSDRPLFVRISASDWAEAVGPEKSSNGEWKWWGIDQSKLFVGELKKIGIDLVDVSSGGLWEKQAIKVGPGYQVRLIDVSVCRLLVMIILSRSLSQRR